MDDLHYTFNEILGLEKFYRRNLINCVSGFKSANLVATKSLAGTCNVAIFSSAVHIGADPPLQGLIFRPDSVDRHTLENIRATKFYTINHVSSAMIEKAHQTSARYPKNQSEFEACGLKEQYIENFHAPFVQGSPLKLGMELADEVPVTLNGTYLIIGKVQHLIVNESFVSQDGFIDLAKAGSCVVSGLDAYHSTQKLARFSYAKPEKPLEQL